MSSDQDDGNSEDDCSRSACGASESAQDEHDDDEVSTFDPNSAVNLTNLNVLQEIGVTPKPMGPSDLSQLKTEGPRQPKQKFYQTTKFGNKMRSFNSNWYNIFPWLEYSVMTDAAYCFPRRHFSKCDGGDLTFISAGFRNWKRALETEGGFKKHSKSTEHKNNEVKWVSYKSLNDKGNLRSVASMINITHLNLAKENRAYISVIADVLLFTATQCISQRGDKEGVESLNRGNFLELLSLIGEHNELVQKKIKTDLPQNAKYTYQPSRSE